ncbi:MAG: hypothetical protein J7578_24045, partial [Chitinophagaceae bacterium]|nr:hypothetical protein [Chitinophagaceae bacterium]
GLFLLLCSCSRRTAICGMKGTFDSGYFIPISSFAHLREQYQVIKIDSSNKLYLIYVASTKDSTRYKIPSMKDSTACRNIKPGGIYPFILQTITAPVKLNNMTIDMRSMPHISSVSFHGNPVPLEREYVKEVMTAVNLSGLCLH